MMEMDFGPDYRAMQHMECVEERLERLEKLLTSHMSEHYAGRSYRSGAGIVSPAYNKLLPPTTEEEAAMAERLYPCNKDRNGNTCTTDSRASDRAKTVAAGRYFPANATLDEAVVALPDGSEGVRVTGWVSNLRRLGKLIYGELKNDSNDSYSLQFSLNKNDSETLFDEFQDVVNGNYIGLEGTLTTPKTGKKTLKVEGFYLPCLAPTSEEEAEGVNHHDVKREEYLTVNFLTPSDYTIQNLPHPRKVRRALERGYNAEVTYKTKPVLIRGYDDGGVRAFGRHYPHTVFISRGGDDDKWEFFGWMRMVPPLSRESERCFYIKPFNGNHEIQLTHTEILNTEIDFRALGGGSEVCAEDDASQFSDGRAKYIKLNFENPLRGKLLSPDVVRADLGDKTFVYAGTSMMLIAQSECDRLLGRTSYHHNIYFNRDKDDGIWSYYGEITSRAVLPNGRVKYVVHRKDGAFLTMFHRDDVDTSIIPEHAVDRARQRSCKTAGVLPNEYTDRVQVDSDMEFAVIGERQKRQDPHWFMPNPLPWLKDCRADCLADIRRIDADIEGLKDTVGDLIEAVSAQAGYVV